MLDSETTDTHSDTPPNDAPPNGSSVGDTAAPAPRKRAPRKAAKKAGTAVDAGTTDAGPASDPAAQSGPASQSDPARESEAAQAAPAKATRRRRATAPAGEPNADSIAAATPVQPSLPLATAAAAMAAPSVPGESGDVDSPSADTFAPARTRRRSTKAAGPAAGTGTTAADTSTDATAADTSTDATAADTSTDATAVTPAPRRRARRGAGAAAAADASGSAATDDAATENLATNDASTPASTTDAATINAGSDASTTDVVAGEADASDAPVRTPRKRGSRKAPAPIAFGSSGTPEVGGEPSASSEGDATAPPRLAVPVLFVAPGTVEVEAPPAGRRRRRATSAVSAPGADREPGPDAEADATDTAELDPTEDVEVALEPTDTDPDEPGAGDDDAGRRRRRRGRRGRGARADEGESGEHAESNAEEAASTDADPDAVNDATGEADDDEGAEGTGSRRRRRRRRGSSADSAERTDDPPNTVVHVRTQREQRSARSNAGGNGNGGNGNGGNANATPSGDDEVRGIRGSSRLEAKRQRRREGRDNGRRRVPILTESEFLARRESVDRLMAVRQRGDRTQIAILEDGVLVEHYVTRASATSYVGNVYLGRVQNVLPSMEAAFVDIGKGRNGVLYAGEVNWDAAGLEGKARAIEAAMKSGDAVLVQVTKDPIGHKGARLTSQISLPGRFLVLVPNGGMTGISRKLPDTERHRLKAILKKIVPEDAGVIVRTAAEGASEEDLNSDMDRLKSQWDAIRAHAAKPGDAPVLVHGEPDLAIRVVRDVFNEDFQSMVVEGDSAWDEIGGYLGSVAPELAARASRHTPDTDLFHDLRVDEQLAKALDRKVWLPSGGSLVIDRTEAMVVIDVNTGKFTGSGGNLEQTVTRNNLEAAEEIVRQLRLRDVGGIIVIDFIDMVLESNRELVLRRLTECLGRDRTKHQVAEVTSLGLVQMTRKRVGEGLLEAFSEPCDKCHGRGVIVHSEPIDQPHEHDIDDGPSRGSGNGSGRGPAANGSGAGNGNGAGGSGGSGNGSARRNRRGRGGQRDDVAVVEEHDDDPERRARAAAAMNAIARHTLSVEAHAATHADIDLMPGGVLDPDAVDLAENHDTENHDFENHDAENHDAENHGAEHHGAEHHGDDTDAVDPAQVRAEIEAALDALPENLIDAALDTFDGDPDSGVIGETSIEFDEPTAALDPQAGDDAPAQDPVPLEGGETADSTDENPLPAQAEPQREPQHEPGDQPQREPGDQPQNEPGDEPPAYSDHAATATGNGRPRRRRGARRPAGPPVHAG